MKLQNSLGRSMDIPPHKKKKKKMKRHHPNKKLENCFNFDTTWPREMIKLKICLGQ